MNNLKTAILLVLSFFAQMASRAITTVPQWNTIELNFNAANAYTNPYTDIEVWAWFTNDKGDSLIRPAFWNGGNTWTVRFAPPDNNSSWQWRLESNIKDNGFIGKKGMLRSVPYNGTNRLIKHGLIKTSPAKRNLIHADGTPFLLVGDTPWALPFRATPGQVKIYAEDRKKKGYNTALLIAVQPDKLAEGPEKRNTDQGFARGFSDFATGHLNVLNPTYFKTLDTLVSILHDHEIIPVFAPLAHGYGWKGKQSLGPNIAPEEYARLCKYLVARYGSSAACWLLSLDGNGEAPGVVPAGETIEHWDAYKQPTGLHYNPCDDFLATWAVNDSSHCFHYNKKHQNDDWLDFQWAQTGHDGKHIYHKVARMYDNLPTKAVMNGESTYEKMEEGKYGNGWWQGEDAWNQLMHGGTMGVVYGAACLWQWKITPDEKGWETWTDANYSWKDALNFEGSNYVGAISKAFEGFDFADMERRWDLTLNNKPLLAKEGSFYISYLKPGESVTIKNVPKQLPAFWFNPLTGILKETTNTKSFSPPSTKHPWVLVIGKRKSD